MKAFAVILLSILGTGGLVLVAFGIMRILCDFIDWIKKKLDL